MRTTGRIIWRRMRAVETLQVARPETPTAHNGPKRTSVTLVWGRRWSL